MAELLSSMSGQSLSPGRGLPLVVTGYGRETIQGDKTVTEITCHARGAQFLAPQAGYVIDIGGQDYKIIKTDNGKVMSFQMNDKCAAGTGRFLEMVLNRLEISLSQMDGLLALGQAIKLNSTCVVFAESEIIGLLAQGVSREEILGGVVSSMATKISSQAARLGLTSPAVLTGGFAASQGICQILSKALEIKVQPLSDGIYAGAIGAACLALEL
jgi:predicted CoA-substrate-specific enzyme activase